PAYHVVAFTATQIPGIETRKYPASLAGKLYPEGIPIFPEEELPRLIERFGAQTCVFAYSDVDYTYIGHRIALANAHGAEFLLLGAVETMLTAQVPVIAVCAVRTGSGKSQDRKSTRLNSSHQIISYAVFCLKKKNITKRGTHVMKTN